MPTPAALATDSAVAVLIAPGLEEVEALAPVDILYRAGIRADLVSVTDSPTVSSSHQIVLTCDRLLSEVDLADYGWLLTMMAGRIKSSPVGLSKRVFIPGKRRSSVRAMRCIRA